MNNNLKIYSKMWAVERLDQSTVPLAYMCHLGDVKSQEEKRKATGRSWAEQSYWDYQTNERKTSKTDELEFDNIPSPGFIITDDIKRTYWGGGNVKWRIEDPRGFEVEISSENLMSIIRSCKINEGKILGEFVWAREGGQNILIPVDSEEYKNSLKSAETAVKAKVEPMTVYHDGYGYIRAYFGKVKGWNGSVFGTYHLIFSVYKTSDVGVEFGGMTLSKTHPQTIRHIRDLTDTEIQTVKDGNSDISWNLNAKSIAIKVGEVKELTYDIALANRGKYIEMNGSFHDVYTFWYNAKVPNRLGSFMGYGYIKDALMEEYILAGYEMKKSGSYYSIFRTDGSPIVFLNLGVAE